MAALRTSEREILPPNSDAVSGRSRDSTVAGPAPCTIMAPQDPSRGIEAKQEVVRVNIRVPIALCASVFLASGCLSTAARSSDPGPRARSGKVVLVSASEGRHAPRGLSKVPPGHYPPPGQCRIWHLGTPPGHQPPPAPCASLIGRVPRGSFILYGGRPWDTEYDWVRHERRTPGSVPQVVLRLMVELRSS